MSLERELVFDLMGKGARKEDVPEIVRGMQSPELDEKYGIKYRLNSKKINVALSQYDAKQEYKKRGEHKKPFKDKLKDLIEKKVKGIWDSTPDLLTVEIFKKHNSLTQCSNCNHFGTTTISARIEYLNRNKEIPCSVAKDKYLFESCKKCGNIS